ncbi:MAG TPA: ABC transporter ATP-binding protein [Candidatus Dormibacteraeota bacterium]|nr:ABC transporter ATP-binding protein [Candidatus Dormibacteraeota bacterium]
MAAVAELIKSTNAESAASAPMIAVKNLAKHYGHVTAVDGVSFEVARGEVFSLLGHNGAGKTTTIRMLTCRIRPSSGTAAVAGFDCATEADRIKPRINLVSQDQNLYERMSGRDNLAFFASLYGTPASRVDELMRAVGMTDVASRRVKTYSGGMKQRLLIARALVNEPEVLFLDEPTAGLDPASAKEVRTLIKDLSRSGTTVFLTTHYMEEADELSDRVAFLAHGKIVALDTPQELKLRYGQRTARVLLEDRSQESIDLGKAADAARMANWMRDGKVLTVHSQEGTLEDVFIALAGRAL